MQFKVGDRVEVLKPAQGTGFSQKNNIGRGTVEAINDDVSEVCVRVDTNDLAWWYDIESVRPLTPSITVGTQVRLTGVVMSSGKDGEVVTIESDGFVFGVPVGALEVIRQPFKRGEVVWDNDADQEYVITGDEDENGKVYAVLSNRVAAVVNVSASIFERRP